MPMTFAEADGVNAARSPATHPAARSVAPRPRLILGKLRAAEVDQFCAPFPVGWLLYFSAVP